MHGLERGPAPVPAAREGEDAPRPSKKEQAPKTAGKGRGKPVPFPTWQRAVKRSAVILVGWAVIMTVLAYTSGDTSSLPMSIGIGLVMLGLTVPLTYLIDRSVWRSARKRGLPHEAPPPGFIG